MPKPTMRSLLCGLALLAALLPGGPLRPRAAAAHPHVFADCTLGFVFDAQGLSGVTVRWVFDEMFTAMILDMVDVNHDGALSPAEVRKTEKEAFSNLKQFGYFVSVSVDGAVRPMREVRGFDARVAQGRLVYAFTAPVAVPAAATPHTVAAWSFDNTYYTDIALATDDPPLSGRAEAFRTAWKQGVGRRVDTPYGGFEPDAVVMTFSKP